MKRLMIAFLISLAATAASATVQLDVTSARDAGFNDLTDMQKADIIKQIATAKQAGSASPASISTPRQVNEWLDVGTRIGQGMSGAAKEMGIAVNQFAATPVGMWTIALITWHFIGGVAIHLFGGLLTLVIGFSVLLYLTRKRTSYLATYSPDKTDYFGRARLLKVVREPMNDDTYATNLFASAVILFVAGATIFSF